MPKLSFSTIGIVVVVVAVVGGIYLYSTGSIPQIGQEQKNGESEALPEVLSIAGEVTSIDIQGNSFVLLQSKEERSFTVKLGENTEFIRLVFPFDINNPPLDEEISFTPEREAVTIEDLEVDDQVFVRSADAIKTGQEIINPLEVQILP